MIDQGVILGSFLLLAAGTTSAEVRSHREGCVTVYYDTESDSILRTEVDEQCVSAQSDQESRPEGEVTVERDENRLITRDPSGKVVGVQYPRDRLVEPSGGATNSTDDTCVNRLSRTSQIDGKELDVCVINPETSEHLLNDVHYVGRFESGEFYWVATSEDGLQVWAGIRSGKPTTAHVLIFNGTDRAVQFNPASATAYLFKGEQVKKTLPARDPVEFIRKKQRNAEISAALVAGAAAFNAGYNATAPVQGGGSGNFKVQDMWNPVNQVSGTFNYQSWRDPTAFEKAAYWQLASDQANAAIQSIGNDLQRSTQSLALRQTLNPGSYYAGLILFDKTPKKPELVWMILSLGREQFRFAWSW